MVPIAFIARLIKGDPYDKGYQKQLIDNLVAQVFVYEDDQIVGYFTFEAGKKDFVPLNETNTAISSACFGVQSLTPLVRRTRLELVRLPTRPSNVRVCQFRHPRKEVIREL